MRWIRAALIGAGCLALLYALQGAVSSRDMRFAYVRFLSLVPTGHELLLMPLAIAVTVLIGRFIPVTIRAVVQTALFISAALTVVALPGVLGYGRSADLPSALPRDYGRGLMILLAAVWIGAAATLTLDAAKRRFRKPGSSQRP